MHVIISVWCYCRTYILCEHQTKVILSEFLTPCLFSRKDHLDSLNTRWSNHFIYDQGASNWTNPHPRQFCHVFSNSFKLPSGHIARNCIPCSRLNLGKKQNKIGKTCVGRQPKLMHHISWMRKCGLKYSPYGLDTKIVHSLVVNCRLILSYTHISKYKITVIASFWL